MGSKKSALRIDPSKLRDIRKSREITIKELATELGIHSSTLSNYESGRANPCEIVLNKLVSLLGKEIIEIQPTIKTFVFSVGNTYSITNATRENHRLEIISPTSGYHCAFRYVGKVGIHHVFVETRGGWTRTYTDAQLIGKEIQKINDV